ncbi:aspartate/glutamate racemase family protein [Streptomyces sp. NBC_01795]|uniref:aspartate/glutamate racemase family protein n=1 Tax=unclassified Streptomyces TaxID=2593676 RepID=UPI002DD8ADE0|nr:MULTISPECIES: aspartate/glutamate racemase family protein [unclassified Streptomyces]WSA90602.1 aspartate/glutamate racemase family protein [Streptomyces sp. NBC_01795]WSB74928.1 aspartate/glutamate racemase family protein [Streptomyces sp. NBC_01775]WSS16791.1 aspartate/glutamate racemase family protein [Streptomyces sp. NBC_01186]
MTSDRKTKPVTRILYLSLSNATYSSNYFPFLRRYIDGFVTEGTEVELRGARVGRIDSFRFFESLDSVSILDSVLDAEQSGFDAVAIGNILDPALREARSMVDIPVLGLGETSMMTACLMGSQFSLVGVNPYFGGRFEENVAKYGLRERLAGIECMDLTPHELDACFSDDEGRQRATDSFLAAARATLARGAEVIIPAGGRVTAFLNSIGLREVDGAPVLDGTASLLAMTESAVRIGAATGSFVSRRRLYAKAPSEVIRSAAAEYAESYGLPALGRLAEPEEEEL